MRTSRAIPGCLLVVLMLAACLPTGSGSGNTVLSRLVPIYLGNDITVVHVDKIYYAGPSVERFKLTLQFVQPFSADGWHQSLSLRILDLDGNQLQSIDRTTNRVNNPFESEFIDGNACRIEVSNVPDLARIGISARLEIQKVELELVDPGDEAGPFLLSPGQEIIGLSLETSNGQQEYQFSIPGNYTTTTVYLSPFLPANFNDAGMSMAIGVDAPSTTFDTPVSSDTGIYEELGPSSDSDLFISVRAGFSTHYFLTVQRLRAEHDIVIELDETLTNGETTFDRLEYETGIRDSDPTSSPNYRQMADYIRQRSSYPNRVKEVAVMGCARTLAASEGFLRFDDVDIFYSTSPFRGTDFHFADDCDRAFAGSGHIQMYRNALENPVVGGGTFIHEWGHYDYALQDEYWDIGDLPFAEPIDWNTIMGSRLTMEFCSSINHIWSPTIRRPGPDSNWSMIAGKYGILPTGNFSNPRTGQFWHPQNQGTYLDVLNRLEELMTIVNYPNAAASPTIVRAACE